MLRIAKYAIVIDVFLSLLFVMSSYFVWTEVNQWSAWNVASKWSPILITAYHIPDTPQVQMPVGPLWNFPFILFWVILVVNLYSIIKLQRGKETKPNK